MKKMTRRDFLKAAGTAAVGVAAYNLEGVRNVFAAGEGSVKVSANGGAGSRAKVYFSKNINADTLIKLYDMINEGIYGKVAIKLHTGEPHGPNILPREMVKAFQAHVPNSNIVETNALYEGGAILPKSTALPLPLTAGISARLILWTKKAPLCCRYAGASTLKKFPWAGI